MTTRPKTHTRNERGMALVTTLLLALLLSVLVGGMLIASTSDTLIGSNDIRNNQAFYLAEAGVNRAAGWFNAKFGTSPASGLFVLPEKYLDSNFLGSNTAGATGKLSYTTGEANYNKVNEAAPYYKPGASVTSPEQAIPTSVKTLVGGNLQNVVLSDSDTTTTYPASYTVDGLNAAGVATTYTYTTVVSGFRNSLVNQSVGDGTFTVKATLISILPPTGTQSGMMTWLLQSDGTLKRGSTNIASATVWAYMSALVTPVLGARTVSSTQVTVNADPGVVARGMVSFNANQITIDSYKSSLGLYNGSLAANTYTGQIGSTNVGSRGDVRTNNDSIGGTYGYINVSNGVITGNAYSTLFEDGKNGKMVNDDWVEDDSSAVLVSTPPGPINIDSTKVMYTQSPAVYFGGTGTPTYSGHKEYGKRPLTFPAIDPIPTPTGSATYSYSSKNSATLPAGNWKNINVSSGQLTIPGGTYGALNVTSQGTIVLGTPGQTTTYNFQSFSTGAQSSIVFAGSVVINIEGGVDVGAGGSISNLSMAASAIHWNLKGTGQTQLSIGGNGNTLGVFYAPNNLLYMRGGGNFYGAIIGQSVNVGGNASIHIDQDAVLPVTTTKKVVITANITVGYTATDYSLWRITQQID